MQAVEYNYGHGIVCRHHRLQDQAAAATSVGQACSCSEPMCTGQRAGAMASRTTQQLQWQLAQYIDTESASST